MTLKALELQSENPFISLRNPLDLSQNFHLLSSSYLFKDSPENPPFDNELSLLFEEIFLSHEPKEDLHSIPKILHLIWIGPKSFPEASIPRLKNWLLLHPDWEFYFWTDSASNPLPDKRAVRKIAYVLPVLEKYYEQSKNFGEMSDLIRISILYDFGGLYFDHDLDCLKKMDPITESSDFMIPCEYPGHCAEFIYFDPKTLNTKRGSFSITNSLIASKPRHPVWHSITECIEEDWEYFTHHPKLSPHEITMHRTYLPFTKGIIKFDPRKHPSFALLPSLFHAPVSVIRLGREYLSKVEGWIFALNYYNSLWKET